MGTYNYPAREIADEINNLLDNLEGDFTIDELKKALGLVAAEQSVKPTIDRLRRLGNPFNFPPIHHTDCY